MNTSKCAECQSELDDLNSKMDSVIAFNADSEIIIRQYCDSCFKRILDSLYYQQTDRYGETCCYCGTKLNEKVYDKDGQISYKNLLITNNPFRRSWDILRLHDGCIREVLKLISIYQ